MASQPTSRVYTVSLPPDLAQKAEDLARRDSCSMDDLLAEALRAYYAQDVRRTLLEAGEYAASRNSGYTEEDVPRLIRESRAEALRASDTRD